MSIFSRIFKIGQAHANKAIDGMEKPEVMIEQAIRDREKHIAEAKRKVQAVIATERQTKALLLKEEDGQKTWEQKAERALMAGNEDLAAKALTRSEEHDRNASNLRPQWETQRKSVEDLKKTIADMNDQLAELKRNKDIIIAQSKAAEVKKDIYEAKARISKKDKSHDLIERMKAKAERSTHEASAAEEMASLGNSSSDSLEKEFAALDSGSGPSAEVQDKLAAMKARLGKGSDS